MGTPRKLSHRRVIGREADRGRDGTRENRFAADRGDAADAPKRQPLPDASQAGFPAPASARRSRIPRGPDRQGEPLRSPRSVRRPVCGPRRRCGEAPPTPVSWDRTSRATRLAVSSTTARSWPSFSRGPQPYVRQFAFGNVLHEGEKIISAPRRRRAQARPSDKPTPSDLGSAGSAFPSSTHRFRPPAPRRTSRSSASRSSGWVISWNVLATRSSRVLVTISHNSFRVYPKIAQSRSLTRSHCPSDPTWAMPIAACSKVT